MTRAGACLPVRIRHNKKPRLQAYVNVVLCFRSVRYDSDKDVSSNPQSTIPHLVQRRGSLLSGISGSSDTSVSWSQRWYCLSIESALRTIMGLGDDNALPSVMSV